MTTDVAGVTQKNGKTTLTDANARAKKNSELDKNSFLYILTAELKNQDPTNTQDTTQYVAQMAQFTALEQQQNANASMTKMLLSQKMAEGSGYIGRTAQFTDKDGNATSETVNSVKVKSGDVYVVTDKGEHNIDEVVSVSGTASSNVTNDALNKMLIADHFTEGLALVGTSVIFTDSKGNSISDTVQNVTVEKGVVYAVGLKGKYDMDSITGVGVKGDKTPAAASGSTSDSASDTSAPANAAAGTDPTDNSSGSGSSSSDQSSGGTAAGE